VSGDGYEPQAIAQLGRNLIALGLNPRALAAWRGTQTLARMPAMIRASPVRNHSRAAFALELFVAGHAVASREAEAILGPNMPALLDLGLLERCPGDTHTMVRARRAILPVRHVGRTGAGAPSALAICDRWDAALGRDATPWPDDSSHHLCGALAGMRAERWLDLGTGSGLAPLAYPSLAPKILGIDIVLATAQCAALGAALSGYRHYQVAVGDLDDAVAGRWDLITCNAPIPAEDGASSAPPAPRWRHAESHFLDRLCERIGARLHTSGTAVVHSRFGALARALARLGGDATSVVYTPPTYPAFAVTWWQPSQPSRHVAVRRMLTEQRPHIDHGDRDDAINNRLPPLPNRETS
jgi:Methyltransferase small domain